MDGGGSGDLTATSFNDLPADVVMYILSRLPAKTLIRFSSVRKSFHSLIRTPIFISKHLHFHSSNTSHLLIVPQNLSRGNPCSLLCDNDTNTRQATFDLPPKTKTPTAQVFEERAMGLVSFGIKEFGGSLSLFVNCFPSDESCSVWWMKEYGNAKSWTKQFTVVLPDGKVDRVFVFTKSGKIIAETYDRKLVSYDPEKKNVQDIVLGDGRFEALGTFTESLVMLERRKRTFF
ncbi:hypothetical protein RHSIM_Rhsim04G0156200 [Rhododendron simsii]|uniref:F-box domain-containing protein n=1 Tax=Rhododendron simsii TaxID=118357 RepID=A0A834H7X7_RHOSS|nr:hypothetical protein RHSIM_Rhsim04G0156200 [Rhododendron simsii]